MAESDRDILFSNESFVIGMLQAVSGGSIVAAIAQTEALVDEVGRLALLIFVTLMIGGLVMTILAAYWKHQYKMWDVKSQAAASRQNAENATLFNSRAARYLSYMRRVMLSSVLAILVGFGELAVALWYSELLST
ncbi:MAG: hypothetical protein WAN46_20445 [Gammaproteobacteria bacterium]|jgi:hydroxymethylglutaryl-CoA reductase